MLPLQKINSLVIILTMKKILSLTLACFTALILSAQGKQEKFWLGADTGWDTEMASKGLKLYNWKGEERECTPLMKEMGLSAIRIRVWVDPSKHGNWCGKEDVLKKALKAKENGMEVMIDFHYSDWWADPAKQNIPAAWEKHSCKKMLKDLADHTKDILKMLKDNGVNPKWVQVGNETSHGLLWSVEMDPVTGWEKKDENGNTIITKTMGHLDRNPKQYAGFIRAGYDAVKEICPDAQVIVHLDNGFDNNLYNKNFDVLRDNGAKWDIIGMSVYPYWARKRQPSEMRTIIDCINNIKKVAKKYGTDVIITETGFEVDEKEPWKMVMGRELLRELIVRCKNDTEGHCHGVFYWEPECRPGQYKLGAFDSKGFPTDIMRAFNDVNPQKEYDRQIYTISTSMGDVDVELYNETPLHRDNFARLATEGTLNGKSFHRIISNFMIQGGDTIEENNHDVSAEICYPRFFHKRGALAAAREGDKDNPEFKSTDVQFYIVWGRSPASEGRKPYKPLLDYYKTNDHFPGTPWLDGGYTVYGEVVRGLDVVEKIQAVETNEDDSPKTEVKIIKIVPKQN